MTVLPSGEVRVVWTANDEVDGFTRNVYGSTFFLPASSADGGVDGGTGGTGGTDAGVCLARTATLQATKTYSPSRWTDADVSFASPFTFALPSEIPVTAGNSGNHWVTMTLFLTGGCQTTCRYRGGASQAHPQGATQLALATRYVFDFCTGQGMGLAAGSAVQVDRVKLHLDNGDSWQPMTRVEVTLSETCTATPVAVCGGNDDDDDDGEDDDDDDDGHGGGCGRGKGKFGWGAHGHGGGKHGGWKHGHRRSARSQDSDVGTVTQALDGEPEPVPAVGCSSASGGLSWLAVAAVIAALALRRRGVPMPVALSRERRRLRR